MNLRMGSQTFRDVQIPLLWGTRAVLQDRQDRLSVIDLSGNVARIEILGDEPAPGIAFVPSVDGFSIMSDGKRLYSYNPKEKQLISISLGLPDCQIDGLYTRVGSNIFSGGLMGGVGVGIAVTQQGMSVGGPIPDGLADLVV